ncbi:SHOCT domain-containing protein [Actinoplanes sp. NPDC049596]|uniref:SHOCT domain-containing protein n=1 Tax=unclassified Actinoplanes TaxID=2626549 RepID=UPI00341D7FEB
MAEPDVLDLSHLSAGLFVEYLGPTEGGPDVTTVGAGDAEPLCDRLWHGHPGVVSEPAQQHVLVTWVGLEDTVASFAVGFSCDEQGSYAGLGILSAEEYERRRARILDGKSPTE